MAQSVIFPASRLSPPTVGSHHVCSDNRGPHMRHKNDLMMRLATILLLLALAGGLGFMVMLIFR